MIESREWIEARLDAEFLEDVQALVAMQRQLDRDQDSIAWKMGDRICDRPKRYGDMTRLAAEIDVPLGTLKNRASVARRIEPARRRDDLSWSHHAEVAGMEPQDGDAMLAEAALYNWSVDRLRHVMRERGARCAAEREVERLRAQVAALKSERSTPEEARRVIEGVRAEVGAGLDMIAQGYRTAASWRRWSRRVWPLRRARCTAMPGAAWRPRLRRWSGGRRMVVLAS